jgi:hypothetical protein
MADITLYSKPGDGGKSKPKPHQSRERAQRREAQTRVSKTNNVASVVWGGQKVKKDKGGKDA